MRLLMLTIALAGCSAASAPQAAPPPAPVAQPTAAQTEAKAANRDSSATREQIKAIQGRLARDGFYRGPIDGVWGSTTSAALGRYQHAHGLEETGKLNHETLDSFNSP